MTDLNKIFATCSPLTGEIFIARFGKTPNLALDKRKANKDVAIAFVEHMMFDAPKGAEQDYNIDGKYYRVKVTPIKKEEYGKYSKETKE